MNNKDIWIHIISYVDLDSYPILLNISQTVKYFIELQCKQYLINKYIVTNYLYSFQTYTNSYVAHYKIMEICANSECDKNFTEIILCNKGLKKIPMIIFLLRNLKIINLNTNRLSSIPNIFTTMINLQYLMLYKNNFKDFPLQLCDICGLKSLSLSFCEIEKIPDDISKLTNLTNLLITDNKIFDLPNKFFTLINLQVLSLFHNNITHIDYKLRYLTNLSDINICFQKNNTLNIPNKFFPQKIRIF